MFEDGEDESGTKGIRLQYEARGTACLLLLLTYRRLSGGSAIRRPNAPSGWEMLKGHPDRGPPTSCPSMPLHVRHENNGVPATRWSVLAQLASEMRQARHAL